MPAGMTSAAPGAVRARGEMNADVPETEIVDMASRDPAIGRLIAITAIETERGMDRDAC